MSYKYDPTSGSWNYVADNGVPTSSGVDTSDEAIAPSQSQGIGEAQQVPEYTDNRDSTETSTNAIEDYNDHEYYLIEGDMKVFTPKPNLKAKCTVKLNGLSRLNGLYFVDKVTHTFDTNGYSQTLSISKNGFGDSIKRGTTSKPPVEGVEENATRLVEVPLNTDKPRTVRVNKSGSSGSKQVLRPEQRRTVVRATEVKGSPSASGGHVGTVYPGGWLQCDALENGYYHMWYITYKQYGSRKVYGYVPASATKPI